MKPLSQWKNGLCCVRKTCFHLAHSMMRLCWVAVDQGAALCVFLSLASNSAAPWSTATQLA